MLTIGWSGRGMGVAVVALAVLAGGTAAQGRSERPVGYVGLAGVVAAPLGELGDYFDAGGGGQFFGALPLDRAGRVRLRADFGFLVYGQERQRLCFSVPIGCRIEMDLTTTNTVLYGGVGPEVVLATGAVEPYLNAGVGFSYFATMSSLSGESDSDEFASTTNFSDAVFAWRAGGGIRIQMKGGRTPVALDLGVERHENGVAEFLTKGDIEDNPDGSITVYPNRTEANLVAFRLGVTVGIPHRGNRER